MARKAERRPPRICPYCLHIDAPPPDHILAQFSYKRSGVTVGGCSCPACDGLWEEFAYRDGRTLLKLRNGRMVDEDELRATVEKGAGEG